MRHLLISLVLALGLFSGMAQAQSEEIEATISAQIEAFRSDDFDRAFTYASPGIQSMFRTSENFGLMVRRGYPMVWRPSKVRYLNLRETDGRFWQRVEIIDAKGNSHFFGYEMVQLETGWKINGVQRVEADLSA